MGELNIASIDFDHKNIKVLHSKSLVIEDLDLALCNIPNDYKRIKQEVDKTALKAHILNTGVSYEGVSVQEKPYLKGL